MRSKAAVGQGSLWDDPLGPAMAAAPAARARKPRAEVVRPDEDDTVHVITGDDFARRGWLPGTRLHLAPASRAERGTLVVVHDGGKVTVGHFGLDRGRPALLTDRGSTWLSARARVVAVVTAVEAPLVG